MGPTLIGKVMKPNEDLATLSKPQIVREVSTLILFNKFTLQTLRPKPLSTRVCLIVLSLIITTITRGSYCVEPHKKVTHIG